MLLDWATVWSAVLMSAISWGELLGWENWVQDDDMVGSFAAHNDSKEAKSLCAGQPELIEPSPVYIW